MNLRKKFSDADLERIKTAVRMAESKISGEIVPVIVEKSGRYALATYRGSMVLAALTFLTIIIFDRYVPSLAVYDPLFIFLLTIVGGMIGAGLTNSSDGIKRLFLSQRHLDFATHQRAETAFLEEEVFSTRHRTGIMIFVSFFEHEVIIMADRGISKVVEQKEWDRMVNNLTDNIKNGLVVEGLEGAITRSGEILLEKGFAKTSDDVNELRDDLRID